MCARSHCPKLAQVSFDQTKNWRWEEGWGKGPWLKPTLWSQPNLPPLASHLGLEAHPLSQLGGVCCISKKRETAWYPEALIVCIPTQRRGGQSDSHGELGLSGLHSAGREGLLQEPAVKVRPHGSLFRNPRSHGILSDGHKHVLSEDWRCPSFSKARDSHSLYPTRANCATAAEMKIPGPSTPQHTHTHTTASTSRGLGSDQNLNVNQLLVISVQVNGKATLGEIQLWSPFWTPQLTAGWVTAFICPLMLPHTESHSAE